MNNFAYLLCFMFWACIACIFDVLVESMYVFVACGIMPGLQVRAFVCYLFLV